MGSIFIQFNSIQIQYYKDVQEEIGTGLVTKQNKI